MGHYGANDHHVDLLRRRRFPKDAHVKAFRSRSEPKDCHVREWRNYRSSPKLAHVIHRRSHLDASFAAKFAAKDEGAREKEQADRSLRDHRMVENPVRSFRFGRPLGGGYEGFASHYAYTLTWTPGHVTLAGDVGELTLTHYASLARFEDGMKWLADGDFEYLIGKGNVARQWDREGSVRDLVLYANAEAFRAVRAATEEARRYRRDVRDGIGEYRAALSAWESGPRGEGAERPVETEFVPDRGDYEIGFKVVEDRGPRSDRTTLGHRRFDARATVPDGFECWYAIWKALVDDGEPDAIFTAAGRGEIKREIRERLDEGGPENCAHLFQKCGFDDFYGTTSWPGGSRFKVEAMQAAARTILADLAARASVAAAS